MKLNIFFLHEIVDIDLKGMIFGRKFRIIGFLIEEKRYENNFEKIFIFEDARNFLKRGRQADISCVIFFFLKYLATFS